MFAPFHMQRPTPIPHSAFVVPIRNISDAGQSIFGPIRWEHSVANPKSRIVKDQSLDFAFCGRAISSHDCGRSAVAVSTQKGIPDVSPFRGSQ